MAGCSGININDIPVFYMICGKAADRLFFFHIFFVAFCKWKQLFGRKCFIESDASINFFDFSCLCKCIDISAYRIFRYLKDIA